jgi:hypothetical protein
MNQIGKIEITGGPSKSDLMLALFESERCGEITIVVDTRGIDEEFRRMLGPLQEGDTYTITITIDGVLREEASSGPVWNEGRLFQGYAEKLNQHPYKRSVPIHGYYSPKNRRGSLSYGQWRFER